jgi:hypothetical protein
VRPHCPIGPLDEQQQDSIALARLRDRPHLKTGVLVNLRDTELISLQVRGFQESRFLLALPILIDPVEGALKLGISRFIGLRLNLGKKLMQSVLHFVY